MAFDAKYHAQAGAELQRRKQTNISALLARQEEVAARIPEYVRLRSELAATEAKIARIIIEGRNADWKIWELQEETNRCLTRIKELLMTARYPAHYLDMAYSCKICRDTGLAGNNRCECYMNAVKRLAAEGINSKSPLMVTGFESFDLSLYPETNKDGYLSREAMKLNFDYCVKYAAEFHLPNTGILMTGKTGLGKTHLSLAIAGRVLSNGYNAIYGSAPDLFRKIEEEHFGRDFEDNTMNSLQSAELLVLDDVGAEWESSKFYTATLYNVLNSRMNLGRPTIVSSNFNIDDLKIRYGERITSRLMTMEVLNFYGNDIRPNKGEKGVKPS
jgi:DNA replication protein DnaC